MKKYLLLLALAITASLSTYAGKGGVKVQTATSLVINELMASNAGMVMSPAINFDSWIELYNPTSQDINLSGYYLSDDEENLTKWQMPSDIGKVPAKGFKVIWLGSNDIKETQAPFKLDCDGGFICVSDKNGKAVVSFTYPAAMSRTAYARTTDGGDTWQWTSTPTPEATNTTAVFASERLAPPVVNQGSQIFSGSLNVQVEIPEGTTLLYTTDGSLPIATKSIEDANQEPYWKNWVINSDCEGEDDTSFVCRDGDGEGDVNRITDGVGLNGSRGVEVRAIEDPEHDWDTQFFVYTPGHLWQSGEKYRFSMKVRAEKKAHISAQAHAKPGTYIHWQMLAGGYNITTEWQEFNYEGTITDEQAGSTGCRAIAFNLNEKSEANAFYFDEISWEAYVDPAETVSGDNSRQSKDGKFTVNKTTNYVFRLFKKGYLPSQPVTRSYITTSNNYTIPVISIVGDESYFSDPKIGIDCDGDGTNGKTGNGQDKPRNYNMPWDRPANFSYISPEAGMLFNQDVNVSISGGWTRSVTPRSMKLKSSKVYELNHLDHSFFPQKPYLRHKTLLVRNGGNDVWNNRARFTDPCLTSIIQRSGIDLEVQSTVQVAEYLNGRFKGILNLREPNNDKFVYANWGYDDEEIDAFENDTFNNGTKDAYKQLRTLAENAADAATYQQIRQLLDVDEFINYMATEIYLGNDDWPNNNVKAYRKIDDGRFRFVCFDLDYTFNPWNHNSFKQVLDDFKSVKMVKMFLDLLNNDEFRLQFINTYCILAGSAFEKDRVIALVDEIADAMRPMSEIDGLVPDKAAEKIKQNIENRLDVMMKRIQQYEPMKLSGAQLQPITLKTDTEGATLLINGLVVPYADFIGKVFTPVTLEAKAPAGYRFVRWRRNKVSTYSTEPVVTLPENTSTYVLTACFEPLPDEERAKQNYTPVCVNEVSAANSIYVNEFFKHNDWVELYNTTDAPIDVAGMYLSDNVDKPKKYQITAAPQAGANGFTAASTVIPAHGYLVIWCDKLDAASQIHASFKLAAEGGDVLLTAEDESWTSRLTYTALLGDQSAGRYPDGSADVYLMNVPTIEHANLFSSYAQPIEQPVPTGFTDLLADASRLAVRYAADHLVLTSPEDSDLSVQIVTFASQTIENLTAQPSAGRAVLSVAHLPAGTYIAHVNDGKGRPASVKFIKR